MEQGKIKQQFKYFKIYKKLHGKPLNCDKVTRVVFPIQISCLQKVDHVTNYYKGLSLIGLQRWMDLQTE